MWTPTDAQAQDLREYYGGNDKLIAHHWYRGILLGSELAAIYQTDEDSAIAKANDTLRSYPELETTRLTAKIIRNH